MNAITMKMMVILAVACPGGWTARADAIPAEAPTFTAVNAGPMATDRADSYACAWGDFDNNDLLDLVVANGFTARQRPFIYRNRGDGNFEKITNGTLATELVGGVGVAWADYNNDGQLDLFMAND